MKQKFPLKPIYYLPNFVVLKYKCLHNYHQNLHNLFLNSNKCSKREINLKSSSIKPDQNIWQILIYFEKIRKYKNTFKSTSIQYKRKFNSRAGKDTVLIRLKYFTLWLIKLLVITQKQKYN